MGKINQRQITGRVVRSVYNMWRVKMETAYVFDD